MISLVAFFLTKHIYSNWEQISQFSFHIDFQFLILSLIFLFMAFFVFAYGWKKILDAVGETLGLVKSLTIWYKAQLTKYVPGMIWHVAGRVYLCQKEGVSRTNAFISIVLEIIFVVIAALIVSLIAFFEIGKEVLGSTIHYYLIGIPSGLLFVHPWVLNRILNAIQKMRNKKHIVIEIKFFDVAVIMIINLLRWVTVGTGFALLANSLHRISVNHAFFLIGAFSFSWAVGFLTFIAPGGLGVREGMLIICLQKVVPFSSAVVIAFIGRIWWTIGELSAFFVTTGISQLNMRMKAQCQEKL